MIDYRENLKMAVDTLVAHKFRSFLTILGIVVGIVVVILLASVLTSLRQSIVAELETLGTNNIIAFHMRIIGVGRPSKEERMRKPFKLADAAAIKEHCPSVEDVAWVMPGRMAGQVQYRNHRLRSPDLNGTSANYGAVTNVRIENGRFFSDSENRRRIPVTVIGPDAAKALFDESDPIGKRILIGGRPFTVVGVTEKSKASFMSTGADNIVLIPFEMMRRMTPWNEMVAFYIQAKAGLREQAFDESESLLRRRRGVGYKDANNFDLMTTDKIIQQIDKIVSALGALLIGISSVGLLVGGVGVMNIMLVSVTERTREIGVRKAIGASRRDIVMQFLMEAMTLSGIGGVFGIILALALSWLVALLVPELPAAMPLWAVVTGLGVSIGIGLVFGVWPARKAARLDPIEALRYE